MHCKMENNIVLNIMHTRSHTMNIVLLEALAWSKMNISSNLVDLNVAFGLAAFLGLLIQLGGESFVHTLLNTLGVVEGPALESICLSHIITCVAAR